MGSKSLKGPAHSFPESSAPSTKHNLESHRYSKHNSETSYTKDLKPKCKIMYEILYDVFTFFIQIHSRFMWLSQTYCNGAEVTSAVSQVAPKESLDKEYLFKSFHMWHGDEDKSIRWVLKQSIRGVAAQWAGTCHMYMCFVEKKRELDSGKLKPHLYTRL